jgi:cobalt-zinc-cadmium resistance protein CzcA
MKFKSKLSLEISQVYNHIVYLQNQENYISIWIALSKFLKASNRRFELVKPIFRSSS